MGKKAPGTAYRRGVTHSAYLSIFDFFGRVQCGYRPVKGGGAPRGGGLALRWGRTEGVWLYVCVWGVFFHGTPWATRAVGPSVITSRTPHRAPDDNSYSAQKRIRDPIRMRKIFLAG